MAIKRLILASAVSAILLAGCGTDPGNGNLSPSISSDTLQAAQSKFSELSDLSQDDAAAALVAFFKSRPEVADAQSIDGCVWARLNDGTVVGVINNRDASEYELPAKAIHPDSAKSTSLPDPESVRLINTLGNWFVTPTGSLNEWFLDRNYSVHQTDGSIEDLKSVSGDGVIYMDAHGGLLPLGYLPVLHNSDGSAIEDHFQHFALLTSTDATQENIRQYSADLQVGNLVMATFIHNKDANGKPGYATHFLITDRFAQSYHWSFSPGALFFVNACDSNADAFKQICFAAGAGFYFGWTSPVDDADSYLAAKFFFDRALGANEMLPARSPPQRPFSYADVYNGMKRATKDQIDSIHGTVQFNGLPFDTGMLPGEKSRGIRVVPARPKLIFSMPAPDDAMLMPSIVYAQMDEANDRVTIFGTFGDQTGEVFMNDSPISANWGSGMITCNIPRSGSGSAGDLYVKVNGHSSNHRHLTAWTGQVRNHQTGAGTIFLDHAWNIRFRADVGSFRSFDGCDLPPRSQFIATYATKDATLTWNAGGSNTSGGVTETWTAGPVHPEQYRIPSALSLTPNNFDFTITIDPTANTLIMGTATYLDAAYYVYTSISGPPGNPFPGHVFRSSHLDNNTYPPLQHNGSFDLAAGLNHFSQSVLLQSTFDWDAMPAESPPDANAPQ